MRNTTAERSRSPVVPVLLAFLFVWAPAWLPAAHGKRGRAFPPAFLPVLAAPGDALPAAAGRASDRARKKGTGSQGGQAEEQVPPWKYKYLAIILQNSGSHRLNAPVFIELIHRLTTLKPPSVSVALFAFAEGFKQLDEGRFGRSVTTVLAATSDAEELLDAARDIEFGGPSPIYDAVRAAMDAAGKAQPGVVLLISNGVDNASDLAFDGLIRRVEKAGVPVIAFYFPTNPPMGGDGRMKKLAKASGGRFVDLRAKDSWDQLLAALR